MGGSKSSLIPPGIDPTLREGNAHYGRRMMLFCRSGSYLSIFPGGKVVGLQQLDSKYARVEFTSGQEYGHVRIRGVEANLYLAMNSKGFLYGEENPHKEETIFIESLKGDYNTYLSLKYAHLGWYAAIKKSGDVKPAKRTKRTQKAVQFLPVRSPFDPPMMPFN